LDGALSLIPLGVGAHSTLQTYLMEPFYGREKAWKRNGKEQTQGRKRE